MAAPRALPTGRPRLHRHHLGRDLAVPKVPQVRATAVGDDPAAAVLLGWVTGGLLIAAWLHRNGYRSMCSQIRRPAGLVGLAVFLAHLADVLGPADVFHRAADRIPVRSA